MAEQQLALVKLSEQEIKLIHAEMSTALTDYLKTEEDKKTFDASFNERLAALWKTVQRCESQLRDQVERVEVATT